MTNIYCQVVSAFIFGITGG